MIETISREQRQALKLLGSGPWRCSTRRVEMKSLDTLSLGKVNSSKTQIAQEYHTLAKLKMVGAPLRYFS